MEEPACRDRDRVGVGVDSGYTRGEGVDIGRRGFDETPVEEVRCLSRPASHSQSAPQVWMTVVADAVHPSLQGTEGYDTEYHPAKLHPPPADMSAAQSSPSDDASKDDSPKEGAGSTGRTEGGERAKKASFMEKMKGEAKVLLGKIEGKQEKVAEGERMKHPETKASPTEPQKETQTTEAEAEAAQEQAQTAPVEQQKQGQA